MQELGRFLIGFGLLIVVFGALFTLAGHLPGLGQLPGDFYYESNGVRIYFPLATCLLLSVVLSLVFYLLSFFT